MYLRFPKRFDIVLRRKNFQIIEKFTECSYTLIVFRFFETPCSSVKRRLRETGYPQSRAQSVLLSSVVCESFVSLAKFQPRRLHWVFPRRAAKRVARATVFSASLAPDETLLNFEFKKRSGGHCGIEFQTSFANWWITGDLDDRKIESGILFLRVFHRTEIIAV